MFTVDRLIEVAGGLAEKVKDQAGLTVDQKINVVQTTLRDAVLSQKGLDAGVVTELTHVIDTVVPSAIRLMLETRWGVFARLMGSALRTVVKTFTARGCMGGCQDLICTCVKVAVPVVSSVSSLPAEAPVVAAAVSAAPAAPVAPVAPVVPAPEETTAARDPEPTQPAQASS